MAKSIDALTDEDHAAVVAALQKLLSKDRGDVPVDVEIGGQALPTLSL
jgi:hypothetical protein